MKTLAELVAYDKANPGKLAWATDGLRNFIGMMAAWLNKIAGTSILTVPYATMPLGIQDTIAGRTQLVILAVPAAAPRIRSGELRPLAASFAKRVPGYENVPAISETFPGFELVGWFLVVAPAGTPQDWTGSSRIRKRRSACARSASSPRAPRRPGRWRKPFGPILRNGAGS